MMTQMYKPLVSFLAITQLPGHNRIVPLDVSSQCIPYFGEIAVSLTLYLISENTATT